MIPAEDEEQDVEEESEQESTKDDPDLRIPAVNHFKLALPFKKGVTAPVVYPRVYEVLRRSPQLFPQIFPNEPVPESSEDVLPQHLRLLKPLVGLPSRHLLRTGRVVNILSTSNKRLVGTLQFEIADCLPPVATDDAEISTVIQTELSEEKRNDQSPATDSINCFFKPQRTRMPNILISPSSVPEGKFIYCIWC